MRKALLTLVPLLFLACDREPAAPVAPDAAPPPSFAATSEWTNGVVLPDETIKYYASCVDDWLYESGPILNSWHTVTTANGSLFYIRVRFLDGYHLVGDRTGTWHLALPNEGGTLTERIPAGATGGYTFHYTLTPFQIANDLSGTVINWPLRVKVTINANGEVTVNRSPDVCTILGKQRT